MKRNEAKIILDTIDSTEDELLEEQKRCFEIEDEYDVAIRLETIRALKADIAYRLTI